MSPAICTNGAQFSLRGRRVHHDAREARIEGVDAEIAPEARVGRGEPHRLRHQALRNGDAVDPVGERISAPRVGPDGGGGRWGKGRRRGVAGRGREGCHG